VSLLIEGHWLPVSRADPRAYALYRRHYSAGKNVAYRRPGNTNIVGPGIPMVLLTESCDALFVWLKNTVARYDHEVGINCVVFRNEGPVLSSELIREADQLAWQRWPGERHFTYVDAGKIRSTNPGVCFKKANWRYVRQSQQGLHLLEVTP
jgi:hypothetical protein